MLTEPFVRGMSTAGSERSLLGRLWRSLACLLWRGCRWRGSSCCRSDLDRRSQGGVMAAQFGANVHDGALPAWTL